ncbi:MAG TPA: GYD domain-containing protein [Dehalococcoidia bacterium]|nr:GYD domain-containing protein [Dehalococcoidia bacterium]
MATYVVLYRFTAEGRKNAKRTVERAEEVRKQNEARGFKVIGMYWTQGRYDIVTVVDAPSEETAMAGMLNIAEAGNVSSETLRAFTAEEMRKIVAQA